ncbi:hypothetical protein AMECASPLE_021588 [Ameca splendens]|uniref:Uncharacterized protein n=1 Tax=Ameca splendens TaxID=208324 RepID=A0ABV0YQG6_9TELE
MEMCPGEAPPCPGDISRSSAAFLQEPRWWSSTHTHTHTHTSSAAAGKARRGLRLLGCYRFSFVMGNKNKNSSQAGKIPAFVIPHLPLYLLERLSFPRRGECYSTWERL